MKKPEVLHFVKKIFIVGIVKRITDLDKINAERIEKSDYIYLFMQKSQRFYYADMLKNEYCRRFLGHKKLLTFFALCDTIKTIKKS